MHDQLHKAWSAKESFEAGPEVCVVLSSTRGTTAAVGWPTLAPAAVASHERDPSTARAAVVAQVARALLDPQLPALLADCHVDTLQEETPSPRRCQVPDDTALSDQLTKPRGSSRAAAAHVSYPQRLGRTKAHISLPQ